MADLISVLQIAIIGALAVLVARVLAASAAGAALALETAGVSAAIATAADATFIAQTVAMILGLVLAWIAAVKLQQAGIDSVQELVETVAEKLQQVRVGEDKAKNDKQPKPTPYPGPFGGPKPGPGTKPDRKKKKKDLYIIEKDGWTPEQIAEAKEKVAALDELAVDNQLVKSTPIRLPRARDRYKAANPGVNIDGKDIDHTHELQLGGVDEPSNMKPMDPSVNRSIGSQIQGQIEGDDLNRTRYGHVYYIDPDDYPPGTKFPVPEGSEFDPG